MSGPGTDLGGARVLVISGEQVGEQMAGPAIRSLNLAQQLLHHGADVTLATPLPIEGLQPELAGLRLTAFGKPSASRFRSLARSHDIVLSQPQRVDVAVGLHASGAQIIYDLYVPNFVERIAHLAGQPGDAALRRSLLECERIEYATAIELGDAFICASQQQRDHWLGALGQAGRLDLDLLDRDPDGRQLIDVVPFGLPDQPPVVPSGDGPLRGGLLPRDSIILLWTGGLWNWFDPGLVLAGFERARKGDPRLRFVVMGMDHPEGNWEETATSSALRARASELGLLGPDGPVTLLAGWVPYRERHRYLKDADAAVSAHHTNLETRFSFRTRFLDQLWCGLPTLTSAGGELTDRMINAGAALAVADEPASWEAAILDFASDPRLRDSLSAAATDLARDYRWSNVAAPLVTIAAQLMELRQTGRDHIPRARRHPLTTARYAALLLQSRMRQQGLSGMGASLRSGLTGSRSPRE